jgi:hypothetical protein
MCIFDVKEKMRKVGATGIEPETAIQTRDCSAQAPRASIEAFIERGITSNQLKDIQYDIKIIMHVVTYYVHSVTSNITSHAYGSKVPSYKTTSL